MIEHLHDREKALEPLGWTGREAEWIALVCLHSGVFTRAQFCFYFEGARRNRASRFVRDLVGTVKLALVERAGTRDRDLSSSQAAIVTASQMRKERPRSSR